MHQFIFFRIWFAALAILFATSTCSASESRPNVIVILADDLGYGDSSLFDGWVKTPQIERLASEGLTFTDFHTNSSVCSPTRAAFLTGRYQQRVGIVDVVARHLDTPGLEASELTISRLLKQNGYRTALFGKWHLGREPKHNPIHHGFDEFVGYLNGAADYHNHGDWYKGLKREKISGYTTHLITDHSVRFIKENKSDPFFLLVSHEAVHLPFQTPADTLKNRSKKKLTSREMWDPKRIRPKYKIMLEEMDKGIGQILDTVHSEGLAENTLIFFFSDNGAIGAGGSNKPFRGSKFSNYEGGHRVPAIAWWPGRIAAGTTTSATTMAMDLFPTIMDFTRTSVPKARQLDGISLADLILKKSDLPDRKLFWGYEPKLGTAMRDGRWKMHTKGDIVELYDLSEDIKESTNVADKYPKRTREMTAAIRKWKLAVKPEATTN